MSQEPEAAASATRPAGDGSTAPATDPLAAALPTPAAATDASLVGPVAATERIASVDVLRGFALLGILVMNIVAFALPDAAYGNPPIAGGYEGADYAAWLASHLFFEMKMMTIFSMLFGAGLVLLADRAEARGARPARVYYRRIGWLFVIGLLHAYFIWWGDILVGYAECGLLLYLFRRRSPRTLLLTGGALMLMAVPVFLGFSSLISMMQRRAAEAEAALAAGKTLEQLGEEQRTMLEEWRKIRRDFQPTPEEVAAEVAVYRDGYVGIFLRRAPKVLMMQTVFFLVFMPWRVLGAMLLGMAFLKTGVFSAARSKGFYTTSIIVGYGLGLPLILHGARQLAAHGFEVTYVMGPGMFYNYFGSLLVAMAHIGLVMRVCQAGLLAGLRRRLGAVGQMALTNYLVQSLIATTLFYGYGLGLFAHLGRAQLLLVVAAIWAFQLGVSPLWLAWFRFGPAEWAWRSLTYGRAQPMRTA